MIFEEFWKNGKYYKTRDGGKVRLYAVEDTQGDRIHGGICYGNNSWQIAYWDGNGKKVQWAYCKKNGDIVGEWEEDVPGERALREIGNIGSIVKVDIEPSKESPDHIKQEYYYKNGWDKVEGLNMGDIKVSDEHGEEWRISKLSNTRYELKANNFGYATGELQYLYKNFRAEPREDSRALWDPDANCQPDHVKQECPSCECGADKAKDSHADWCKKQKWMKANGDS